MPRPKAIHQYLARHAEPECALEPSIPSSHEHVLVIPSYAEGETLLETLASIPSARGPVLTIVVVNERCDSADDDRAQNDLTVRALTRTYGIPAPIDGFCVGDGPGGHLLVLRRTLPAGQGVGLARKMGADLALAHFARGRLEHPYIHCTDADAKLPPDYFSQGVGLPPSAAQIRPFFHHPEGTPDTVEAMLRYEISLRYYVLGLAWAGSPYAFHTIGSTLAVHCERYAQVRGFPKRQAGEDFYLLNKLRKLGPVIVTPGAPIEIRGRLSQRTPFGTGRALSVAQTGHMPTCYHPGVFTALRAVVTSLEAAVQSVHAWREALSSLAEVVGFEARLLFDATQAIGAPDAFARIHDGAPEHQRGHRLRDWLDGLRTLKLIHHLRAEALPSTDVHTALKDAPFIEHRGGFGNASLETMRLSLCQQEYGT